jgi:hypothetical protein
MVVETKMTPDRLDQAKVVDELVIDEAHYRQHPDCKTLVCSSRTPNSRRVQLPEAGAKYREDAL